MFASGSPFKNVSCPKGLDCELLNCIFSHYSGDSDFAATIHGQIYDPASAGVAVIADEPPLTRKLPQGHEHASINIANASSNGPKVLGTDPSYNSLLAGTSSPPPFKKRRLNSEIEVKKQHVTQNVSTPTKKPTSLSRHEPLKPSLSQPTSPQTEKSPSSDTVKSIRRPVSPPAIRSFKTALATPARSPAAKTSLPAETLNPRMVTKAPESHKNRLTLLKTLHQLMDMLNKRTSEAADDDTASLSPQEVTRLALDEEERMAQSQEGLYRAAITGWITRLKKMQVEDWRKFVLEKFPEKAPPDPSIQISSQIPTLVVTGLNSVQKELEILRLIRTPLEGLESYGYITAPPSKKDIDDSRKGVQMAAGFEVCDRCGVRFQVFPGRNEDGRLTSRGSCQYHWGKLKRPAGQTTDRTTGQQQSSYPCCNKGLGSEGCTTADTHIFKVTDPKRLASILQFERTPQACPGKGKTANAVAFDCEMGFTTLGMELIRVTTISWPQNKELLDVLVRTQGEILDLNTRFSGVTTEAYITAPRYNSEEPDRGDDMSEEGKLEPKPLRKVESPAAARKLMFDLLTPDTLLIGHAIENDLNACRMIHPSVVDTVLLYPHPRGLPIRYGLRMLTSKYLERGIQMGGPLGHDSKEDATATGDLVKIKVKEEWRRLRNEGWIFDDERLVAPESRHKIAIRTESNSLGDDGGSDEADVKLLSQ